MDNWCQLFHSKHASCANTEHQIGCSQRSCMTQISYLMVPL
uniref:Uncharacterized protein n=1 Tax=Arundo donax TaxID=35708 RepID=A0A0A9GSV5_ARUDO